VWSRIGVNLAGILGDVEADRDGVGKVHRGEVWGVRPVPRKKWNFSLEVACFGEFVAVIF